MHIYFFKVFLVNLITSNKQSNSEKPVIKPPGHQSDL